jgi:hypothetical protein
MAGALFRAAPENVFGVPDETKDEAGILENCEG